MKTSALVLTLFLPILVNGVTKDNFAISNQKVSSGNDDDDFETISFTDLINDVESGENLPYVIIDVRTVPEFNAGSIPGSVNVPNNKIVHYFNEKSTSEEKFKELVRIPRPTKETKIVLVCRSRGCVRKAAKTFRDQVGHSRLRLFEGHFKDDWILQNGPCVCPPRTSCRPQCSRLSF